MNIDDIIQDQITDIKREMEQCVRDDAPDVEKFLGHCVSKLGFIKRFWCECGFRPQFEEMVSKTRKLIQSHGTYPQGSDNVWFENEPGLRNLYIRLAIMAL